MALKRSAAASPPCSTSEVCFASRRPRSAAASPHGRVPCGGSAPLVPLFLCRAVGASSKLKGGARKVGGKSFVGAPSRGGLRERKTSCRRLFNAEIAPPGAILQSARALFSRRATPPRGSNGRSLARDPPDSSCGGSAVASHVGLLRRPPFPWIACGNLENSRPWDFLGRFSGLTRPEKTPSQPFRKSQGRKKNSRKKCYVKAPRPSTTQLLT